MGSPHNGQVGSGSGSGSGAMISLGVGDVPTEVRLLYRLISQFPRIPVLPLNQAYPGVADVGSVVRVLNSETTPVESCTVYGEAFSRQKIT